MNDKPVKVIEIVDMLLDAHYWLEAIKYKTLADRVKNNGIEQSLEEAISICQSNGYLVSPQGKFGCLDAQLMRQMELIFNDMPKRSAGNYIICKDSFVVMYKKYNNRIRWKTMSLLNKLKNRRKLQRKLQYHDACGFSRV